MTVKDRLEYLRGEIEAERISYGEIVELQDLAPYIEDHDVVLRQWAGIPEFPETHDPITVMRNQINALDQSIANLVLERARVSHRVQDAKQDAGQPRVDISREREVRAHYAHVLGWDGEHLADAILTICRGQR